MTIEDLSQTFTLHPAKYAKGMIAVHCKPDGTGWKTLAALIISGMPGVRYSGRESAYICSLGRAVKFEAEMARVQKKREVAALVDEAHATGKAITHLDGDPTNNDMANLRVVTLKANQ